MTERNRSTEKNTMLGFCKGNKMMSSAIWCEKIKVKISKTTKLHEPYLQSRKKNLQLLIFTKLHEKSNYHLLLICITEDLNKL